jgi:DNA-binding transcriptional MerR regulator
MLNEVFSTKDPLDQEWVDLILDALDMGMTVQEIQVFLQKPSE